MKNSDMIEDNREVILDMKEVKKTHVKLDEKRIFVVAGDSQYKTECLTKMLETSLFKQSLGVTEFNTFAFTNQIAFIIKDAKYNPAFKQELKELIDKYTDESYNYVKEEIENCLQFNREYKNDNTQVILISIFNDKELKKIKKDYPDCKVLYAYNGGTSSPSIYEGGVTGEWITVNMVNMSIVTEEDIDNWVKGQEL